MSSARLGTALRGSMLPFRPSTLQPGDHGDVLALDPWFCVPVFRRVCPRFVRSLDRLQSVGQQSSIRDIFDPRRNQFGMSLADSVSFTPRMQVPGETPNGQRRMSLPRPSSAPCARRLLRCRTMRVLLEGVAARVVRLAAAARNAPAWRIWNGTCKSSADALEGVSRRAPPRGGGATAYARNDLQQCATTTSPGTVRKSLPGPNFIAA
jgi:hypothetical protein